METAVKKRLMFFVSAFFIVLGLWSWAFLSGTPQMFPSAWLQLEVASSAPGSTSANRPLPIQKGIPNRLTRRSSVLVTGGAGFIGLHTSLRLKADGISVVAYDILDDTYDVRLKHARVSKLKEHNIPFVKADVCNSTALDRVIVSENITHVIHLAAKAGVRGSLQQPLEFIHNNIECFGALLEVMKQHRHLELSFASSSSIYGDTSEVPFREEQELFPRSPYAMTKQANELEAETYWRMYGVKSVGLRFFTVYGPWGRPNMAYFSFSHNMTSGRPINVFNNGDMSRDFTFVDDIVDGILGSCGVNLGGGGVNLGNSHPEPLSALISNLETSLGMKAQITHLGMQNGDVKRTYADISWAKQLFGYSPKVSLKEGIDSFVHWYKYEYPTVVPVVDDILFDPITEGSSQCAIDRRRRVIDATMINAELSTLEIRLNELWNVVDVFYIMETTVRFRPDSKPKRLWLTENWERFKPFHSKIVVEVLSAEVSSSADQSAFGIQAAQRSAHWKALRERFKPTVDDLIIMADLDEIPRPHEIEKLACADKIPRAPICLTTLDSFYYYNYLCHQKIEWTVRPKVITGNQTPDSPCATNIPNASTHCSSCFGSIEEFQAKANSNSEPSRDPLVTDPIALTKTVQECKDFWRRERLNPKMELRAEVEPSKMPLIVNKYPDKWPFYFGKGLSYKVTPSWNSGQKLDQAKYPSS